MKTLLKLFAAIAMLLIISSCEKDKKKGCTIASATNYCSDCEENDGSCQYEGKYLAWWRQAFSDSCQAYGIATIQVFVDGSFAGSLAVSSQYWTAAPECGSTGTLTITKSLGNSTLFTYSGYFKLLDGSGNVLYTSPVGTQTLTANTCTKEELTW